MQNDFLEDLDIFNRKITKYLELIDILDYDGKNRLYNEILMMNDGIMEKLKDDVLDTPFDNLLNDNDKIVINAYQVAHIDYKDGEKDVRTILTEFLNKILESLIYIEDAEIAITLSDYKEIINNASIGFLNNDDVSTEKLNITLSKILIQVFQINNLSIPLYINQFIDL